MVKLAEKTKKFEKKANNPKQKKANSRAKIENLNLENKLHLKLAKYRSLTQKALSLIEIRAEEGSLGHAVAEDFLAMAQNYYSDALFFEKKGDFLTALAAYSYAHAWLDAGVRARLFHAEDNQLFTLPE